MLTLTKQEQIRGQINSPCHLSRAVITGLWTFSWMMRKAKVGGYLDSDDAPNGFAGDDHKAIVMQLMTNGTFTWTLNAEIWINGDPNNAVIVSQTYNGSSLELPVILGCVSPTACNFYSLATTDDGTCEFPQEYYDCDGGCLNDSDGDGVCDELEILGCQDDAACNYMETATEAGACIHPAECEFCSGATDGSGYAIDNDQDDDGVCDDVDRLHWCL